MATPDRAQCGRAGRALTFERCIEVAQANPRLPGKLAFRVALKFLWQLGITSHPARGGALHDRSADIMNTGPPAEFLAEL